MAVRSTAFCNDGYELSTLGLCASRIGSAIARFSGGAFARPMFQASMVQNVPAFEISDNTKKQIREVFDKSVHQTRFLLSRFEPWQEFVIPAYLDTSISDGVSWQLHTLLGMELERQIENDAGFSLLEAQALCLDLDEAIAIRTRKDLRDGGDHYDDEVDEGDESQSVIDFSERSVAEGFVSYLVGVVFGRWDVRIALNQALLPPPYSFDDPPPACPAGTLFGPNGLPAKSGSIVSEEWLSQRPNGARIPHPDDVNNPIIEDSEYPTRVHWDGIMVDDNGHDDDLVSRVRDVLAILCKDTDTEESICTILGCVSLRQYFRKSGNNGFSSDHINRYKAKRGRKAPIYWLLQSNKKNFALWIYYHRLDSDTIFKTIHYVDTKIQREENHLKEIQSKISSTNSSSDIRRLERDLEKQEDIIADIQDFADKLREVSELQLKPDLHDGVNLNIAPFREVAAWKDANRFWKSLTEGKNAWSSISKQLRKKSLVNRK